MITRLVELKAHKINQRCNEFPWHSNKTQDEALSFYKAKILVSWQDAFQHLLIQVIPEGVPWCLTTNDYDNVNKLEINIGLSLFTDSWHSYLGDNLVHVRELDQGWWYNSLVEEKVLEKF